MDHQTLPPAFVFVPGAFHSEFHFRPIISELNARGYPAQAVSFPSIGPNALKYGLKDEIQAIHDVVEDIIGSRHRDVVIVPHSYGGWPASRAIKDLDKPTRQKLGFRNGIIHLFWMNAFIVPEGTSVVNIFHGNMPDWIKKDGRLLYANENAGATLFNDMEASERNIWLNAFEQQSNNGSLTEWPHGSCWGMEVPKTSMLLTNDVAAPLPLQEMLLASVKDDTWTTTRLHSGHEPFLSHTKDTASLLLNSTVRQPNLYADAGGPYGIAHGYPLVPPMEGTS